MPMLMCFFVGPHGYLCSLGLREEPLSLDTSRRKGLQLPKDRETKSSNFPFSFIFSSEALRKHLLLNRGNNSIAGKGHKISIGCPPQHTLKVGPQSPLPSP